MSSLVQSFHRAFDVVFVEPSGFYNVLGQMNKCVHAPKNLFFSYVFFLLWIRGSFLLLQAQARLSLQLLDSAVNDRLFLFPFLIFFFTHRYRCFLCPEFTPLLLTRLPLEASFDALLRVKVTPAVAVNYGPQLLDRGDWVAFARHFVLTVLRQGIFCAASF
jgi:hypothetical protein